VYKIKNNLQCGINSFILFSDAVRTQAIKLKIKFDYSYPVYQSVVGMLFIIVFLK